MSRDSGSGTHLSTNWPRKEGTLCGLQLMPKIILKEKIYVLSSGMVERLEMVRLDKSRVN